MTRSLVRDPFEVRRQSTGPTLDKLPPLRRSFAAMANTDRVIAALQRRGPLSNSELVRITGIRPYQQINQLCRRLEARGALRRVRYVGGTMVNILSVGAEPVGFPPVHPSVRKDDREQYDPPVVNAPGTRVAASGALLILPRSARKQSGGTREPTGETVFDLLPASLGDRLARARQSWRSAAGIDESVLLPASRRYRGALLRRSRRKYRPGNRRGDDHPDPFRWSTSMAQ
jgi:hypothetical protein